MDENFLEKFINNISEKEIEKLRKSLVKNSEFDDYFFETAEKIFKKLIFPYVRFEILLKCLDDIKDNDKYYSNLTVGKREEINQLSDKINQVCLHLNLALENLSQVADYLR